MTLEEYKKEYKGKTIHYWYIIDVARELKESTKKKLVYFKAKCTLCGGIFLIRPYNVLVRGQASCNECRIRLEKEKMLGVKKENNDGYMMEIARYGSDEDIDVKFFNGEMVYKTSYKYFKDGFLKLPSEKSLANKRIGETKNNKDGLEMQIYYYNSANDLGVVFTFDGVKVNNRTYYDFTEGVITHPNIQREHPKTIQDRELRVGYEFTTVRGVKGVVIDYKDATDCTVRLENNLVIKRMDFKSVKKGHLPKEYKTLQLLGMERYSNSGVKMKISRIKDAHDIDVEFADGSKSCNKGISAFYSGKIAHPTIKRGKGRLSGKFLSFDISFAFRLNEPDKVFYFCKCNKCGLHDILTPHKMFLHLEENHPEHIVKKVDWNKLVDSEIDEEESTDE